MDTEACSSSRSIVVYYGVDVLTRCNLVARAGPSCRFCSILCRVDKRKQSQQRPQQNQTPFQHDPFSIYRTCPSPFPNENRKSGLSASQSDEAAMNLTARFALEPLH